MLDNGLVVVMYSVKKIKLSEFLTIQKKHLSQPKKKKRILFNDEKYVNELVKDSTLVAALGFKDELKP